jgi:hypothetical protein
MKKLLILSLVLASTLLVAGAAKAAAPDRVDGFVCPVISTDNVLHSPKGGAISEGFYTIGGPDVSVPEHATNENGAGSPGGEHSDPGDTDYTAIWAR